MSKLNQAVAVAIANGDILETEDGILFPKQGILAKGEYFGRVNGGEWEKEGDNLITAEGLAHILNVSLGATAKPAGYYIALFGANVSPAGNWTAASFPASASEITSMTEGYTAANRPVWTPAVATAGSIDNMATPASLTIATASTVNIYGAALLTSNVRGGTGGVLVSASKYAAMRTFQDGDTYEVGYRINLTV
jgi:hypothetical protein